MHYYHADYRRIDAMSRRKSPASEPATLKRRLLRRVLKLQSRKLAAAERKGDADAVEKIARRMVHVEALLDELEARS